MQNPASSHSYSLLSWLILSGVGTEVCNDSGAWVATSSEYDKPLPSLDPIITKTKTAPTNFTLQKHHFADLQTLQNWVTETKDFALKSTAHHTLQGQGVANPALMIICDAPDNQEDMSGQSFSGPGNRLILQALTAAGFDMAQTYRTYLSKWRPPGQRGLSSAELNQFGNLLQEEIRLIQPKAILSLGEGAYRALTGDISLRQSAYGRKTFIEKEWLNNKPLFIAFQKGEFLVKNPSMKKSFWLGLLDFAAAIKVRN